MILILFCFISYILFIDTPQGTAYPNSICQFLWTHMMPNLQPAFGIALTYTRKNLTTCSKSANKRQQVVFARLVTSCQQVWNKLLTTCNNLVDIVRIPSRLFQQGCYSHDITILLQPCVVNLVTFLLYHDCIRLVRTTL